MPVSSFQPQHVIGQTLADDRYRIAEKLGEGSMAWVFKARDARLQTDVVIKVPKVEKITEADFLERFRRESQLMVRLTHPHVVSILDVGEHDDLPYVVMQYLAGGTLKDQIVAANNDGRPISANSLRGWVREVARALDFVHTQKVVHRDVKPANILFDEHRNAFLSDFGLTKIMYGDHRDLDSEATAAGFVIGTPNYVAPELVLGTEYDGRADQYSLGITLYHTLTGSPPMQGASSSATMVNQTQKELPLLSKVRSDIPPAVANAIHRSIEKKPENRFGTCEELAVAVIGGFQEAGTGSSQRTRRPGSQGGSGRNRRAKQQRPSPSKSQAPERAYLSNSKSDISRGPKGAVPCPGCREVLPLKQMHAGRTGRCIHCNVRLAVSKDLSSLKILRTDGLPPRARKKNKSGDSSGEMILGEKVFGWEVSRQVAVWIAAALVAVLVGATVYLTLFLGSESAQEQLENEVKQIKNLE